MIGCGLSHAPPCPPHFLSSCISSHGQVSVLTGQSSGKILAQIDPSFYMRSHPHAFIMSITMTLTSHMTDLEYSDIVVGLLKIWMIQQILSTWKHNLTCPLQYVTPLTKWPVTSLTPNVRLKILMGRREDCHHMCQMSSPVEHCSCLSLYRATKLSGHISHAHQPRKDTPILPLLIPAHLFYITLWHFTLFGGS